MNSINITKFYYKFDYIYDISEGMKIVIDLESIWAIAIVSSTICKIYYHIELSLKQN